MMDPFKSVHQSMSSLYLGDLAVSHMYLLRITCHGVYDETDS